MSEKMNVAYDLLRAKDEVDAEKFSFVGHAVVLFALGLFCIYVAAWAAGALAVSAAAILAFGPCAVSYVLGLMIRRTGYDEIELERANLK